MFTKIQGAVVLALFIQCLTQVSGQEHLISFGDFLELHVGVLSACGNVTGGGAIGLIIISAFSECVKNIGSSASDNPFEDLENICRNRGKYLNCWDKMKTVTMNQCGNNTEPILPVVYRATMTSFCGNDGGASKSAALKMAAAEHNEAEKCPEETGIHWLTNCEPLLNAMHSPDICARHGAIDQCLRKISCDNIKIARLLREVYTNAKPYLQCNGRRA